MSVTEPSLEHSCSLFGQLLARMIECEGTSFLSLRHYVFLFFCLSPSRLGNEWSLFGQVPARVIEYERVQLT